MIPLGWQGGTSLTLGLCPFGALVMSHRNRSPQRPRVSEYALTGAPPVPVGRTTN
jgi:hypothetical protein